MVSELLQKQFIFSLNISRFIAYCYEKGYTVTMGEGWRPEEVAALYEAKGVGIKNSLHCLKLAHDLFIFKGGKWIKDKESLQELGTFWEGMNIDNRWGGNFSKLVDSVHFSVQHMGVS